MSLTNRPHPKALQHPNVTLLHWSCKLTVSLCVCRNGRYHLFPVWPPAANEIKVPSLWGVNVSPQVVLTHSHSEKYHHEKTHASALFITHSCMETLRLSGEIILLGLDKSWLLQLQTSCHSSAASFYWELDVFNRINPIFTARFVLSWLYVKLFQLADIVLCISKSPAVAWIVMYSRFQHKTRKLFFSLTHKTGLWEN